MAARACVLSLAFAFALVAVPGARAERLQASDLAASDAFRDVPAHELLGVDHDALLAFGVAVPSQYRSYQSTEDLEGNVLWAKPADWTRVRHRKRLSGLYGAFVAMTSDLVRWSARHGEFRDGTGMNDANMAERLAGHDAKNVRVVRIDRPGVPMLLVEADLSHLETLRAVYVSTPRGTRKLYYLPQRPWSEADVIIWARMRDSLTGGAIKDARPPR